jgi:hypothetical protein
MLVEVFDVNELEEAKGTLSFLYPVRSRNAGGHSIMYLVNVRILLEEAKGQGMRARHK